MLQLQLFLEQLWSQLTFEMFLKFIVIYFVIIWVAVLIWVIRDISDRTDSVSYQLLCVSIILLLTPFGIFIYLLIRPGKTLFDKYYEEIEDNLEMFAKFMEEKIAKKIEKKSGKKKEKKK